MFDIESVQDPITKVHMCISLCANLETYCSGLFSRFHYVHHDYARDNSQNVIAANALIYDYLDTSIPNLFESSMQAPKKSEINQKHYSLCSTEIAQEAEAEIYDAYRVYLRNRQNYGNLTPEEKASPLFHFLVFLLQPLYKNSVVLSHYGSAYDGQFIASYLCKMGVKFDILSQGAKIIQIHIKEYAVTFLDSWKYFSIRK